LGSAEREEIVAAAAPDVVCSTVPELAEALGIVFR
jgi:hypothetical protein